MKTIPTRPPLAHVIIAALGITLVFPAVGKDTANTESSAAKTSPTPGIQPDQQRGVLVLSSEGAHYEEGNHFAHWNWDFEAERPGRYEIRLIYTSVSKDKMGVQFRLNDTAPLKAYVYRSRNPDAADEFVIGRVAVPAKGKHRITLLTGDKSKVPPFSVKGLKLVPVSESEGQLGQGLDGTIELHARDAVTHSEKMQYEHNPQKDCLGFWVQPEDWAEWDFHVSMPGEFKVALVHGCGNKSGGSEVALLTSKDQVLKFSVKETGGFQNWETIELGRVILDTEGSHRVAVQPLSKPGAAVMDIRKIVLTPVK
jgi:hypothetical protein